MLSIKNILENQDQVIELLKIKNLDAKPLVEEIIRLDKARRDIQQQMELELSELNKLSKQIGLLFREGKTDEANLAKSKTAAFKESSKNLKERHLETESELYETLVQLPNLPHPSVPEGKGEEDNLEIKKSLMPEFPGSLKPHWEIADEYKLIDFELGVKITGAGFPVYKNKGAKLQRALINFFLDEGDQAGYDEILPPILVNEDSGFGTGQLPDKEGQMYHAGVDNLYLIPTAEVPVTNIYRDVILQEDQLPLKNIAYTPCFRREAGSWGAHVRGLNRLHQFDKVEVVQVRHPDDSYDALKEMVAYVESLVQKLGLPYRILLLCGGDISFTSALTYDFEVYSAGQKRWLEVSSVSNFVDFQANRLKLRYKDKETKKNITAHTLNGSALALPRIVAAILENYQRDNYIEVPEVLQKYTGFDRIDKP
ncbi:MAG: serine--tRNA ligase [Bacteroidota bacterium]|nr:serine--tRNA ligase [Bacteroidota bacterium]